MILVEIGEPTLRRKNYD